MDKRYSEESMKWNGWGYAAFSDAFKDENELVIKAEDEWC